MKEKLKFKPLDFVIIALFALAVAFSFIFLTRKEDKNTLLVIKSQNGEEVYPLNRDRTVLINGPLGITEICIKDGKAFFADSPCPNKTCVKSKPLAEGGDWAACLPNQVMIHIESHEQKLDAISE